MKVVLKRYITYHYEGELKMAKIVMTHNVVDVTKWLSFKDERASTISAMGGTQIVDCPAQDGSNTVAVSANFDDVEAVLTAMSSPPPEMQSVMEKHGVLPPLAIYVEK
jgi:hypothetical protein